MADVSAQAPSLQAGQATTVSFSLRIPAIVPLLLVGLGIRLALALIDGFRVDMGTFQAWSTQLANDHPWNFYKTGFFADYAPGYMYVLWLIGEIHQAVTFTDAQYQYALKIPSIVADLGSAWLLWLMLKEQPAWKRHAIPAIYLLLPPVLWIGAIWGQVDSILSFFLLLSVYYIGKDRPVAGAVAYTIGFLVKPQAIAALPILAFWIVRKYWPDLSGAASGRRQIPKALIHCTVIPLVLVLVLITPFFQLEPWRIFEVLYDATNVPNYRVNSFWAYNFWNMGGIFEWGFRCDLPSSCPGADANPTEFMGIATRYWGVFMFGASLVAILLTFRKKQGNGFLALAVGLSMLAFYMFMTRMHERYVFPAFLPLLLACALLNARALWAAFAAAAAIHFVNLYHVYGYYYLFSPEDGHFYPDFIKWERFYEWIEDSDILGFDAPLIGRLATTEALSMVFLLTFFVMLAVPYALTERPDKRSPAP